MAILDHLAIDVASLERAVDWYTSVLGLEVEFERAEPPIAGLKDDGDFTLILRQAAEASRCNLFFRVQDVNASYRELTGQGVEFRSPPQLNEGGHGAELLDPDHRLVGLWDEESMGAGIARSPDAPALRVPVPVCTRAPSPSLPQKSGESAPF